MPRRQATLVAAPGHTSRSASVSATTHSRAPSTRPNIQREAEETFTASGELDIHIKQSQNVHASCQREVLVTRAYITLTSKVIPIGRELTLTANNTGTC